MVALGRTDLHKLGLAASVSAKLFRIAKKIGSKFRCPPFLGDCSNNNMKTVMLKKRLKKWAGTIPWWHGSIPRSDVLQNHFNRALTPTTCIDSAGCRETIDGGGTRHQLHEFQYPYPLPTMHNHQSFNVLDTSQDFP